MNTPIYSLSILDDDEMKALEKRKFVDSTREGITAKVYYQTGWLACHEYYKDKIENILEEKYGVDRMTAEGA
jgi:hypothetical protein